MNLKLENIPHTLAGYLNAVGITEATENNIEVVDVTLVNADITDLSGTARNSRLNFKLEGRPLVATFNRLDPWRLLAYRSDTVNVEDDWTQYSDAQLAGLFATHTGFAIDETDYENLTLTEDGDRGIVTFTTSESSLRYIPGLEVSYRVGQGGESGGGGDEPPPDQGFQLRAASFFLADRDAGYVTDDFEATHVVAGEPPILSRGSYSTCGLPGGVIVAVTPSAAPSATDFQRSMNQGVSWSTATVEGFYARTGIPALYSHKGLLYTVLTSASSGYNGNSPWIHPNLYRVDYDQDTGEYALIMVLRAVDPAAVFTDGDNFLIRLQTGRWLRATDMTDWQAVSFSDGPELYPESWHYAKDGLIYGIASYQNPDWGVVSGAPRFLFDRMKLHAYDYVNDQYADETIVMVPTELILPDDAHMELRIFNRRDDVFLMTSRTGRVDGLGEYDLLTFVLTDAPPTMQKAYGPFRLDAIAYLTDPSVDYLVVYGGNNSKPDVPKVHVTNDLTGRTGWRPGTGSEYRTPTENSVIVAATNLNSEATGSPVFPVPDDLDVRVVGTANYRAVPITGHYLSRDYMHIYVRGNTALSDLYRSTIRFNQYGAVDASFTLGTSKPIIDMMVSGDYIYTLESSSGDIVVGRYEVEFGQVDASWSPVTVGSGNEAKLATIHNGKLVVVGRGISNAGINYMAHVDTTAGAVDNSGIAAVTLDHVQSTPYIAELNDGKFLVANPIFSSVVGPDGTELTPCPLHPESNSRITAIRRQTQGFLVHGVNLPRPDGSGNTGTCLWYDDDMDVCVDHTDDIAPYVTSTEYGAPFVVRGLTGLYIDGSLLSAQITGLDRNQTHIDGVDWNLRFHKPDHGYRAAGEYAFGYATDAGVYFVGGDWFGYDTGGRWLSSPNYGNHFALVAVPPGT